MDFLEKTFGSCGLNGFQGTSPSDLIVYSQSSRSEKSPKKMEQKKDDHFVEQNGVRFAGIHLLLEFWGASGLTDQAHILQALHKAAVAAGASVLKSFSHEFSPYGGVTAIVVLAESHISIHTWPERDYAAIDIFMCGDARPHDALPALRTAFAPKKFEISEHLRGLPPGRNEA